MITLKKDEKRLITVLLDSSSVILNPSPVILSEAKDLKLKVNSLRDLKRDSSSSTQNDSSNGKVDIVLAGENSSVEVVGLVLGKGNDVVALDANIVHAARNTKSNVNVRAVLRDRSTFSFRGNVKIEYGAKGSDAYLRSDALLFDEAKMGDDTPALEILEQDVKAGHAATVGKVDEEMVFYLMTRGLTRDAAERMIIEGFVEPIEEKIRNSNLEIRNKI